MNSHMLSFVPGLQVPVVRRSMPSDYQAFPVVDHPNRLSIVHRQITREHRLANFRTENGANRVGQRY